MEDQTDTVALAADLTIAWLSNSSTRASADDALAFLRAMHEAVNALSSGTSETEAQPAADYTPAVTARKSLANPDHIISMLDGKPYKSLTRHLSANGLTPADYRARYGLKADYPMTAPNYSKARSVMAKALGLGRKRGDTTATPAPTTDESAPKRRGRKPAE